MMAEIKKNFFYFFFVTTGTFYIDVSGTQQCYNIGDHAVCYFIGSEQLSEWHLAYEICERKNSTLPIIRNAKEQNVFEEYLKYLQMQRSHISFVWTAGKRTNFDDWIWINGQPVSDNVRRSIISDDSDHTHAIIMMNHSIAMRDPDFLSPFLCQFYGDRCLMSGRIKLTNSCVVISNYMDTWFNARSGCLARGGDLAVLSDLDLQVLKNYSQQLPAVAVWIGLRNMSYFWQLDSEGKQTEEIKYKKWGRQLFKTFGDECIHIEAFSGNWIIIECIKKHSIVCQMKGLQVYNFSSGSTTAKAGDVNAWNQSTEPQSGFIRLSTFVLTIVGVVLVCIAFSAVVGIIAARKVSATKNLERNFRQPTNAVYSNDSCALQLESAYEYLNESRY